MTERRKNEIDKIVSELTKEFHENAHNGDGNFGCLWLSTDIATDDIWASLEAERENFKRMILSLMEMDRAVAEDIIEATESYAGPDPLNLKAIAG